MKKSFSSIGRIGVRAAVLLCAVAMAAGSAMAQDTTPPPPPQDQTQGPPPGGRWGRGPGGPGGNPERRIEMMQKQLNLSTDQTTQLRTILGDERTKMETLRSNESLSREDRGRQMMAIHQDGQTKIEAMLTADQKTKFEAMEARMRERGPGRGPGGPGGPGGPDGAVPPPPPQPPQ